MSRLLIVGAGGFGREVLAWARDAFTGDPDRVIGGFLDDNPKALDGFLCDLSVLGSPLDFPLSEEDQLICAIGSPAMRLDLCSVLRDRGARFATLIHPTAVVGTHCEVGEGSILCPGAVLTTNVRLGRLVILNVHATVGHDSILEDGCTLSAHADVTGCCRLGRGVLLGSHAVTLPGARVGDFATVGAGSVVLKIVEERTTVMGVPARKVAGF